MPPEEYNKKFVYWIELVRVEKVLTIQEQIKNANKKRIKAVKKENYLKAAKYRDILKNLTKK